MCGYLARDQLICFDTEAQLAAARWAYAQQQDGRTARKGSLCKSKAAARLRLGSILRNRACGSARLGSIPQAENSARLDRNEPSRRLRLGSARFCCGRSPARLGSKPDASFRLGSVLSISLLRVHQVEQPSVMASQPCAPCAPSLAVRWFDPDLGSSACCDGQGQEG